MARKQREITAGFLSEKHGAAQGSGKLLITPGKEQVRRLRERLSAEVRAMRGANAAAVMHRLNPVIRGWSAYERSGVSGRVFARLDHHVWHITYRWARHSHPNKSRGWVAARYFGRFNKSRQDRWVFGDRDTGAYLAKFAWTKIVRHVPVRGWASPDDPALARYWADRRRKRVPPPADQTTVRLLRAQDGRCPGCGEPLLPDGPEPRNPSEWEQWLTTTRQSLRKQYGTVQAGGQERAIWRLLHASCHWQQATAGHRQ